MSVWDRKPRASKADGVGRKKFNSLEILGLLQQLRHAIDHQC
jgi:hypothetical protein